MFFPKNFIRKLLTHFFSFNVIHRFWSLYNEEGAEEMNDGRTGGHNKIFSLDLPAQFVNESAQASLLLTSKTITKFLTLPIHLKYTLFFTRRAAMAQSREALLKG